MILFSKIEGTNLKLGTFNKANYYYIALSRKYIKRIISESFDFIRNHLTAAFSIIDNRFLRHFRTFKTNDCAILQKDYYKEFYLWDINHHKN